MYKVSAADSIKRKDEEKMKTDIQIAQEAQMKPIKEVAETIGIQRMIWNFMESTKQNFLMNFGIRSKTDQMENLSL